MAEYNLSNVNILFADQSKALRTVLRSVLRELGVRRMTVASNAEEAFEAFVATPHDLVLTDWGPAFDGIGLALRIRRDEASPNQFVPIIVMTANTERRHVYEALDAGMTEFLAKPVSAMLIYRRIRAVIENHRRFVKIGRFFGPDRRRRTVEAVPQERRVNSDPEMAVVPNAVVLGGRMTSDAVIGARMSGDPDSRAGAGM